jgi:membrane fusion protein (multidrug efflux system)
MKKVFIWVITIVIIIVIIIVITSHNKSGADNSVKKDAPKFVLVNGRIIHPIQLPNTISVSGTTLSNQEVSLQSQVAGIVTKVYFTEGSHVKQGELLLKIDDSQFQAQLQKDEVAKQLAELTEQRQKKLLAINGISQQDYDIALNNLNGIIADMKLIQVSINYTNITAPFDGIVGLKNVSVGSYITTNNMIADMEQVTPIKIDFYVPEKYLSQLEKDEAINFTVSGYPNTFQGKIFAIDPKLDMSTGSIHIRAISENKDGHILPGEFASISIILSKTDSALMVPSVAIIPKTIGQSIYACRNGKAVTVNVQIGSRTDSTVEVVQGLHNGDTIVTDGTMLINNGSLLKFKQLR